MFNRSVGLVLSFLFCLSAPLMAQVFPDPEAWERDEAWRASASVDTSKEMSRMQTLIAAQDDTGSLALLDEIRTRSDWPAPARERFIFEFVSSLREQPPHAAGPEIVTYLQNYQSMVLVPHEDHPRAAVPLFNIKGAATGVVNEWSRQEAAYEGAVLISEDPLQLIRAFESEVSHSRSRGLLDALDSATHAQLTVISNAAIQNIEHKPVLIAVARKAAIMSKNIDALTELAATGRGSEMHHVFRDVANLFDIEQTQQLLDAALSNPSRVTSALAIAQLAHSLSGNAATEQLLLQLLDDQELGSSAALALAVNPSELALQTLEALASSGDSELFATRARLALQLRASMLQEEARR